MKEALEIVVEAGERARTFCPVSVDLEMPADRARELVLTEKDTGVAVPAQVSEADAGCRLHWIMESAVRGQTLRYTLGEGSAPAAEEVALNELADGKVEVRTGKRLLTCLNYGEGLPRPFLYPVVGPYGDGITRPYPMEVVEGDHTDHPHHRSVWVAWGDVNGSDNWGETEETGRVLHAGFEEKIEGPAFGQIATRNDWVDVAGNKLMEDRTVYRFHNLPADMGLIEMEVDLIASEAAVCLGDTKEGGICSVRVAAPMEVDRGGKIENSFGGVNEPETWGKRANWCDYSGVVNDHQVGIAVFDHPENFRHPTYWHVRNYGLMTANPFGLSYFIDSEEVDGSYTIPAGASFSFSYAVYVHAGDAGEGNVGDRYLDWIYPPAAQVAE